MESLGKLLSIVLPLVPNLCPSVRGICLYSTPKINSVIQADKPLVKAQRVCFNYCVSLAIELRIILIGSLKESLIVSIGSL